VSKIEWFVSWRGSTFAEDQQTRTGESNTSPRRMKLLSLLLTIPKKNAESYCMEEPFDILIEGGGGGNGSEKEQTIAGVESRR
jgi:hypothetical protein